MKTRKIMENGNSTEEMGQEIQVATSDQIRINYSPFSVNLRESAANKAIRWLSNRYCSRSNSQHHRPNNSTIKAEARYVLGSRSIHHGRTCCAGVSFHPAVFGLVLECIAHEFFSLSIF